MAAIKVILKFRLLPDRVRTFDRDPAIESFLIGNEFLFRESIGHRHYEYRLTYRYQFNSNTLVYREVSCDWYNVDSSSTLRHRRSERNIWDEYDGLMVNK